MVKFDVAEEENRGDVDGFDPEAPPAKSKSFASKSLGESEKTGIQVTLYQLRYKVPAPGGGDRYLLGNPEPITGTMDPGMMIALMGSSGAGKSTLMDVISKRKTQGAVEGLVLFDGHVPGGGEVSRDTGYVEQRDSLWGFFSVTEMLLYTARLKMPDKYTLQQKTDRVTEVIDQLGLTKSKDTKIGGAMVRGVSGGEAKRISIAIGLLNNPRIMFFDEPTSGLDSAISLDVMSQVRTLADEGRTVLVTIHQPSGKVFGLFSDIILLSRDAETKAGNIAYYGPAGEEVKSYFVDKGYPFDADEVDNIAEYLLNIVSGGVSGPKGGNELIEGFHNSEICDENERIAEGIANAAGGLDHAKATTLGGSPVYNNSFFSEVYTLTLFKGRSQWKDVYFAISRLGLWIVASLLIISMYADQPQTPLGLFVVIAILFITIFITALITVIYIPSLINDKPVFIRESHDACYRPLSYATSNFLIETSATFLSSICYASILYWAVGPLMKRTAGAFFFFMLTQFLYATTATVITLTLAAPMPNIELAAGGVSIYCLLNVAVMGFLSPVPPWWGWAAMISYMRWTFGALMINQFTDNYVNICADVPEDQLISVSRLENVNLTAIESGETSLMPANSSPDSLICSLLTAMEGLANQPQPVTTQSIVDNACPGANGLVGNLMFGPPSSQYSIYNPAIKVPVERFCEPIVPQLLYGTLPSFPDFAINNTAAAILDFFPMQNSAKSRAYDYASNPRFSDFNMWYCLLILLLLFFNWYFLYWQSCKLSIKLVKR
jgi:ABC-type multidrug transport system ATPase subunit/ABC-type multidrug transport system permease subunit